MPRDNAWSAIFNEYFKSHDFDREPAQLTAEMIRRATRRFRTTGEREVRILAKFDCREDLPPVLADRNLFILPVRNKEYRIVKGEGFHDIEPISTPVETYQSGLDFELISARIGNSEMQRIDYAFNTGLVNHFAEIESDLFLQIRGCKYTPKFSFRVGQFHLSIEGVQTEVDAGYEGRDVLLLVEAKNTKQTNVMIRQLYYPFRQWSIATGKHVFPLFFSFADEVYSFWRYQFDDEENYNSIHLTKSARYRIQ